MRRLIDTTEAAELLGVSAKTLERWRLLGCGPRYHKNPGVRGACRYDPDTIARWLAAHERQSTSDEAPEVHPRPAA